MANLFQDIKATFRAEPAPTGTSFYTVMDNGIMGTSVYIMKSQFQQSAAGSAGWLSKVGGPGSPVTDDEILHELLLIGHNHYTHAGIALINELCNRTCKTYDSATHTAASMGVVPGVPSSTKHHTLFGSTFLNVQIRNNVYGVDWDGTLVFQNLTENDADALVVWINQVANTETVKDLDVATWLVRNLDDSQLLYEGTSLIAKLCVETGHKYSIIHHAITDPSDAFVDDEWCDDHNDQDTFGIGKPGAKSTKGWEPDVPDPSVDLMKSIRDISDRSRL